LARFLEHDWSIPGRNGSRYTEPIAAAFIFKGRT
jgi:hypothetical protein